MSPKHAEKPAPESIDLKDPPLAAFLAWLLPGLGHWYQGRRAKAVLFFICIVGLFVFGLFLSSSNRKCIDGEGAVGYGRAVYFSWNKGERTWAYLCQVCVGLPALPAMVQAARMAHNKPVWWGGFMAPPRPRGSHGANEDQPTLHDLHRLLHRYFELGWVFTTIAGLLNVLAIYDAWAGPVISASDEKKETKNGKHQNE